MCKGIQRNTSLNKHLMFPPAVTCIAVAKTYKSTIIRALHSSLFKHVLPTI